MNIDQITQQLVASLNPTNLVWPGTGGEPVLSRVVVGPVPEGFFQHDFVSLCAILHVESSLDNDEHPADLVEEAKWSLWLFAENAGSQSGGDAVVGGNRHSLLSSRGRGLLEIEPLVKAQIFNTLGLTARPRSKSGTPTNYAGKMAGVVAQRALEISATRIPSLPSFGAVQQLALAAPSSERGAFSITNNTIVSGAHFVVAWDDAGGGPHSVTGIAGTDFAVGATAFDTATNYVAFLTANGTFTASLHALATGGGGVGIYANALSPGYSVAGSVTPGHGTTWTSLPPALHFSWAPAPLRYDLVGYTWRRASGVTPPAAPTSGSAGGFVAGTAASFSGSVSFIDTPSEGVWSYSFFWAYDVTTDPYTGTNGTPPGTPSPNAWSSSQSSQDNGLGNTPPGLLYLPASLTVSI